MEENNQLYLDLNLNTITVVIPAEAKNPHCPAIVVNTGNDTQLLLVIM